MPPAKRNTKKTPTPIDIEPEPEFEDLVMMTIEAHAAVDAIEPERAEDGKDEGHAAGGYRITFHTVLSEEIAQEFFQKFVQDGMVSMEFFPAQVTRKTRFEIVRR